ncbi:hypothetical protein BJ980_002263 [Nocardioides daedukensis]|uniref:Uncharacterized protein n=1 Tax=Nocardioides daedukensis TaxID=634462 RepID=A0A7Y9UVW6_9ACTN|nr:hypothetical protein [Nocardioides daedukensis]NYG59340.1 hypothetical protein [Nocardioides daedukensis]
MRDLADLGAQVRDPDSRPHFDEAVRAFQAGALRAAVVEAWVAVSLDLTNKIRHLAETGDGGAATAIKTLDAAVAIRDVPAMQAFERSILEECERSFELITSRERVALARLYEDRNLCAHPAFIEPGEVFAATPELVRSHLAAAVDCALSLPPVSGKKIVENLQRDLDSNSWPRDADVADYVREQYFSRTRDSVQLNLVKLIVKCAVRPPAAADLSTASPNQVAHRCRVAVNAVNDVRPDVLQRGLEAVVAAWVRSGAVTDEVLLRLVGALGHLSCTWQVIDGGTRARLAALLESAPVGSLIEERTFASGPPAEPTMLASYNTAIQAATADFQDLDTLVRRPTLDSRQWVAPAVEALANAGSFRSAESRLRCVLRLAPVLTADDLATAAASIRGNNQIYQASDTPELLSNLFRETQGVPGGGEVWLDLAQGLHDDYMADHTDADGYFSYSGLLAEVAASED